jgi:hypothetical protein
VGIRDAISLTPVPALEPGRGHGDFRKVELVLLPEGAQGNGGGTEDLFHGIAAMNFDGEGRLKRSLVSLGREEGQGFRRWGVAIGGEPISFSDKGRDHPLRDEVIDDGGGVRRPGFGGQAPVGPRAVFRFLLGHAFLPH